MLGVSGHSSDGLVFNITHPINSKQDQTGKHTKSCTISGINTHTIVMKIAPIHSQTLHATTKKTHYNKTKSIKKVV